MKWLVVGLCASLGFNFWLVCELITARWAWRFWRRQFDKTHADYMQHSQQYIDHLRARRNLYEQRDVN